MRLSWSRALLRRSGFGGQAGAPLLAVLLLTIWIGADFVEAQGKPVRINGAIDKLVRGKSLAGAIIYDFSLYAAAQFASSDLDFIIVDMEHRGLDFERLEAFLFGTINKAEIAKQGNLQVRVPPIVRIPTYGRAPSEAIVKQVLDMGAFGIMFPAIENREQALEAVSAARYPQMRGSKYPNPVGRRGNGNMPAAWFWGLPRPEYGMRADVWPANPDGELLLFLQIETVEGVKNVDEILSVPGIGVVFVGPNDLSWSLGVPQGSPEHNEAVQTVLNAAMKRNIPAAITVTPADVVSRLKQGFRIASLPSGGLEAPMDETLKIARTVIGK